MEKNMEKKRFWVFADVEYHPAVLMNDFKDSFDLCNEAEAFCKEFLSSCSGGWTHIYDSELHPIFLIPTKN